MTNALRLACDPRSVRTARDFVTRALGSTWAARLADTVTLLTSEVVTNAILHARTTVTVSLAVRPDRVRVEVWDDNLAVDPVQRTAADDEMAGRGISLVSSLSLAWGVERTARSKCVWFEVGDG